jgi:hypothetical protein
MLSITKDSLYRFVISSCENLNEPYCIGSLSLKQFKNNIQLSLSICFILLMYFFYLLVGEHENSLDQKYSQIHYL